MMGVASLARTSRGAGREFSEQMDVGGCCINGRGRLGEPLPSIVVVWCIDER